MRAGEGGGGAGAAAVGAAAVGEEAVGGETASSRRCPARKEEAVSNEAFDTEMFIPDATSIGKTSSTSNRQRLRQQLLVSLSLTMSGTTVIVVKEVFRKGESLSRHRGSDEQTYATSATVQPRLLERSDRTF